MPVNIPSLLNSTHGLTKGSGDHGWPGTDQELLVSMWVKMDIALWTNDFRRIFSDSSNRLDCYTNLVSGTRRWEQSLGYASGFTRSNNAAGSFVSGDWNHLAWLYTAGVGLTEFYTNGTRITRNNTGTTYTAGALGTVRLFSRTGSGLCFPTSLVADVTAWSGGVAGASGNTHLLCQALAAGQSPETTPALGHTLAARNRFRNDLEGWAVQGGTIFIEDTGDYPPVVDYMPAAGGPLFRGRGRDRICNDWITR